MTSRPDPEVLRHDARCRNWLCRREIREHQRRDLVIFGSMEAPLEVIPKGGCVYCCPGEEDEP